MGKESQQNFKPSGPVQDKGAQTGALHLPSTAEITPKLGVWQ